MIRLRYHSIVESERTVSIDTKNKSAASDSFIRTSKKNTGEIFTINRLYSCGLFSLYKETAGYLCVLSGKQKLGLPLSTFIITEDGGKMFENFTLADLKNAPLSIVVFLSMNGNRAVSVTDLAAETGFSEKPIRAGLRKLQDLGVVISPRNNRYQLTGKEYQLPLSWGEKILLSGDYPEITGVLPGYTGVSPDIERRIGLLEKAVFGTDAGDSPEVPGDYPLWDSEKDDENNVEVIPGEEYSGNIPGKLGVFPIEGRKSGNTTVTGQWSKKESSADSPEKTGVSPDFSGDIPEALINNNNNTLPEEVSKYVGKDTYLPDITNKAITGLTPAAENAWNAAMGQIKGSMDAGTFGQMLRDAELMSGEKCTVSFVVSDCGVSPEAREDSSFVSQEPSPLLPESGDPDEEELVEICNDYLREPVGIEYTVDQMSELVAMHPDPRVLRWILPKATKAENAKAWCRCDFVQAKHKLLKHTYEIGGDALKEFSVREDVSLQLIDRWCGKLCPEDPGLAVTRIKEFAGEGLKI